MEASHKSRPKFPYEIHSDSLENDNTVGATSTVPQQVHNCIYNCSSSSTDLDKLSEESGNNKVEADKPSNADTQNVQKSKADLEHQQKDTKNGENIIRQNSTLNLRVLTQSNDLICPDEVKVSSVCDVHTAEPVLTVFGMLTFLLILKC